MPSESSSAGSRASESIVAARNAQPRRQQRDRLAHREPLGNRQQVEAEHAAVERAQQRRHGDAEPERVLARLHVRSRRISRASTRKPNGLRMTPTRCSSAGDRAQRLAALDDDVRRSRGGNGPAGSSKSYAGASSATSSSSHAARSGRGTPRPARLRLTAHSAASCGGDRPPAARATTPAAPRRALVHAALARAGALAALVHAAAWPAPRSGARRRCARAGRWSRPRAPARSVSAVRAAEPRSPESSSGRPTTMESASTSAASRGRLRDRPRRRAPRASRGPLAMVPVGSQTASPMRRSPQSTARMRGNGALRRRRRATASCGALLHQPAQRAVGAELEVHPVAAGAHDEDAAAAHVEQVLRRGHVRRSGGPGRTPCPGRAPRTSRRSGCSVNGLRRASPGRACCRAGPRSCPASMTDMLNCDVVSSSNSMRSQIASVTRSSTASSSSRLGSRRLMTSGARARAIGRITGSGMPRTPAADRAPRQSPPAIGRFEAKRPARVRGASSSSSAACRACRRIRRSRASARLRSDGRRLNDFLTRPP